MRSSFLAELTAGVFFVGVSAYLLKRMRDLERRLAAATAEQQKALAAFMQKLDTLGVEERAVASVPRLPAQAPSVSGQSSAREQLAWESMSARSNASGTDDASGYKTADEEVDEAEGRSVARRAAETSSPVKIDDWAARSIVGEGSWSCVDGGMSEGGGTAASGSGPGAPGSTGGTVADAQEDSARAAAEKAILRRVDSMYQQQEYEAAAELLACSEQSVDVLWRRCRVLKELADAAKRRGQAKQCEAMLKEGLGYVTEALERDDSNFAVHKWYAIAISSTSSYEGTKATIEKSFVVREHFTKACELNPVDATSRHLLGLWYYEVASLSWTMRKLAAAIFASPPTGSFDEALAHFQLAEGIQPGFYVRNRLMLAKCQKELRDKAAAKQWASLALELPCANHDDRTAADEAKALLASL